ncbi:PREDICTED: probable carboxylesterase 2 [Nelumbo nucifera]|uniref:Alpha/beta hydrolase fold-3 domain-containing protein n=2 Tax=Nelumbo nucifera TaxID=4432 RepID=A0A822XU33_NELNU|nr:PREDICTED: probable carboxylesterase 2 [Nelumbo nucifera]DAD22335.1 TPA_asm: hypothetical protein HUJ06_023798 [Nelumbo nucifera]
MDMSKAEVDHEFLPFLRVYKDGHVERLLGTDSVPASLDSETGVSSKDVLIVPDSGVSARLYLPKLADANQKLPILVYFHGGGFIIGHPSTPMYHHHLNLLVAEANIVAVSVAYRLAPENPIPAAYDDSWAALQWVASHSKGEGPESWLTEHADFGRVFLAGESSGANIAHHMAMRAGDPNSGGLGMEILGIALVHPHFWGATPIGSEAMAPVKALFDRLWPYVCPSQPDNDDPQINPLAANAPSLLGLGCTRVIVFVAGKDALRDRGWLYYESLARSGWIGVVEFAETEGEEHGFHLYNPNTETARELLKRLAFFLNRERPPLV